MDQNTPFDLVKMLVGHTIKCAAERVYGTVPVYLELHPHPLAPDQRYRDMVAALPDSERWALYAKIWELAKMEDSRVAGWKWGEQHAFDDLPRLNAAMHRLGLFVAPGLYRVECIPFRFGEGGLGAQYFSLGERLGRDPLSGRIGYINGMGVRTLEQAGRDVVTLSDRFVHGNNVHVVYNPTHQQGSSLLGFAQDSLRMKAVDGGATSKQAYLVAQLWLDYLHAHPQCKFLQVAHSEGAVHVNGALRLMTQAGAASVLDRIRILNFCPAHFIHPAGHPGGLQIVNFVKLEDSLINPWGTGSSAIGRCNAAHVRIVTHRVRHDDHHNNPHDFMSWDFVDAARLNIETFMRAGDIE